MTTQHAVISTPSRPPPLKRWTRRVVPLVFAVVLVGAGVLTLERSGERTRPGGSSSVQKFSHTYPPDPVVPERPKVLGHSPKAPPATLVNTAGTIHSFAELAKHLPRGVLHRVG